MIPPEGRSSSFQKDPKLLEIVDEPGLVFVVPELQDVPLIWAIAIGLLFGNIGVMTGMIAAIFVFLFVRRRHLSKKTLTKQRALVMALLLQV